VPRENSRNFPLVERHVPSPRMVDMVVWVARKAAMRP
jgi:hypothetical protein